MNEKAIESVIGKLIIEYGYSSVRRVALELIKKSENIYCGKDMKMHWNSSNPGLGYSTIKCQKGLVCKECAQKRRRF